MRVANKWRRRAITLPVMTVAFAAVWTLLPLLLFAALAVDVVRKRQLATTRSLVVVTAIVSLELVGVVVAGLEWIRHGGPLAKTNPRFLEANYRLQNWWTQSLLTVTRRAFGLNLLVEGQDAASPGPILLLVRHASVGDTLFPSTLVAAKFGLRLRYVLKDELLWDPCLDIVGNRLPNVFVSRGADPTGDRAAVESLTHGLGPRDGIALFPEGTRFSPERRRRALQRIADSGRSDLLRRAERLEHTLPPRLTGLLALLNEAPTCDVVVLAHVGFDGIRRLSDLLSGALVGRSIRVRMWRIRARDLPRSDEERIKWIYDTWQEVDNWVAGAQRANEEEAGLQRAA